MRVLYTGLNGWSNTPFEANVDRFSIVARTPKTLKRQ